MGIKCFMVEKTGEHRSIYSPDCGTSEIPLWKRLDTGEILTQEEFPPGAMWFAPWYANYCKAPDGTCLIVRTPGGDWVVDSVASNCTRKDDKIHKCWVREGIAPNITVGKNGDTCSAGAGSILIEGYHGFLRNGVLDDA